MACTHCGGELPVGARFCPSCGQAAVDDGGHGEGTTASIDLAGLDPSHVPTDLAALPVGTAMLVVVRGPGAGSRYLLDRDETRVGRHPEAHVLLDDVTVSRLHASVRRVDGAFEVVDHGSLNGTYVNGERVELRPLVSGDEVQVGRFKLLFVSGGGTGAS